MTEQSIQPPTDSPVPTEPGWYLDRLDVPWRLNNSGWWAPTSSSIGPDATEVAHWAPFTRLFTLSQAATLIADRFLDEDWRLFDSDHDNALVATRITEIGDDL